MTEGRVPCQETGVVIRVVTAAAVPENSRRDDSIRSDVEYRRYDKISEVKLTSDLSFYQTAVLLVVLRIYTVKLRHLLRSITMVNTTLFVLRPTMTYVLEVCLI